MSIYSEQVKTNILNTVYHNNQRTVFRLPPKVMLSNLRLADVGCRAVTALGGDVRYPALSGCYSIIKNMYLWSDNELIDQCRDCHRFLAFWNTRRSNAQNYSMNQSFRQSSQGYQQDYETTHPVDEKQVMVDLPDRGGVLTNDVATTSKATLYLDDALRFLVSTKILPADKLANLRLEIEWNDDKKNFWFDSAGDSLTSYNIIEPVLIYDEVMGQTTKGGVNVQYLSLENDRLILPAVAVGSTTQSKYRINGFNGKILNRCLFCTDPVDWYGEATRKGASVGQNSEVIQTSLNGVEMIPYKGVDSPAKKQMMINDIWGYQNTPSFQWSNVSANAAVGLYGSNVLKTNNEFSWGAQMLGARVDELQLQYQRKGEDADATGKKDLFFHIYGEVSKTLKTSDNGRSVVTYN